MTHQTLSSYLDQFDVGLFETMEMVKELDFFKDYPPDMLDQLFITLYGDQWISWKIEDKTLIELSVMLIGQFGDKWNDLYTWFNVEHPFNASSVDNIEETVSINTSGEQTSNSTDYESAYNVDEFAPLNKSDSDVTDLTDSERTRSYKQTRESLQALTIRRSMIEREVLTQGVFKDVKQFICLGIY